MTLEDVAFDRLLVFLDRRVHLELIHAHPPSGKSYLGDLVQFSAVLQARSGAQRSHVDFIACSESFLYLGELKGKSSESATDEDKLHALINQLGIAGLKTAIRRRLTRSVPALESASSVIPIVGCTLIDSAPRGDVLYLEFGDRRTRHAGLSDPRVLRDLTLDAR